ISTLPYVASAHCWGFSSAPEITSVGGAIILDRDRSKPSRADCPGSGDPRSRSQIFRSRRCGAARGSAGHDGGPELGTAPPLASPWHHIVSWTDPASHSHATQRQRSTLCLIGCADVGGQAAFCRVSPLRRRRTRDRLDRAARWSPRVACPRRPSGHPANLPTPPPTSPPPPTPPTRTPHPR